MSIERRDLLKRGAAVGVVAWTAPTILAAPAMADGACSPKCAPVSPQANVEVLVDGYCPGPGKKAARVNLRVSPTAPLCPCTDVAPTICRGPIPSVWEKDGTGQTVVVGATTPAPGYDIAFYVEKPNGALGQGLWVPTSPIRVYLQCADEEGDVLTSYCDYLPSYTFRDAGRCGSVVNFQPGLVSCGLESCNFTPEFCA